MTPLTDEDRKELWETLKKQSTLRAIATVQRRYAPQLGVEAQLGIPGISGMEALALQHARDAGVLLAFSELALLSNPQFKKRQITDLRHDEEIPQQKK